MCGAGRSSRGHGILKLPTKAKVLKGVGDSQDIENNEDIGLDGSEGLCKSTVGDRFGEGLWEVWELEQGP